MPLSKVAFHSAANANARFDEESDFHSILLSHRRMDAHVAKCVLLTKVLAADGIITENERAVLDRTMKREGLGEAERDIILNPDLWGEAEATVAKLPEEERRAILSELMEGASVDGRLSPLEAATIKQITAAIGL